MSSLTKSRIFALLALGVLLYWFVIPAVLTHNVVEMGHHGKGYQVSDLTVKVWDYYQKGRYVSPNIPKEDANNLQKMIQDDMELNVVTAPLWYVSLEAPNY
ncbi:MAG: cytochrome C, partial [Sulfurovum sp.]|nr:cytochrome C [Sulfurovum sp.]